MDVGNRSQINQVKSNRCRRWRWIEILWTSLNVPPCAFHWPLWLSFGEELIEFLAKTWMESPRWQLRTLLAESHGRIRRKARDLALGFLKCLHPQKFYQMDSLIWKRTQVLPLSLRRGDRCSNATDWIQSNISISKSGLCAKASTNNTIFIWSYFWNSILIYTIDMFLYIFIISRNLDIL